MLTLLLALTLLLFQSTPLTVIVRDADGMGVAGAAVTVVQTDGTVLATGQTDARGVAVLTGTFSALIQVQVTGYLANGTPLQQVGGDAAGIPLLIDAAPTILDLRVEADGTVVPDPATMITQDGPTGPIAPTITIPDAPLPGSAASAPSSAVVRTPTAQAVSSTVQDDAPTAAIPVPSGYGWFALALFALLAGGVVVAWQAYRRGAL